MGAIRLQNVTKQFGGQIVLDSVSLDLHAGQIAALIGANGVGKTTLFRLIAGQLAPDIGTITVSKGLEVGYLPQEPDIAPAATLRAAVAEAFADLMVLEQKLQALAQQIADEHDGPQLSALLEQYDRLSARFDAAGGYRFEQRLSEVLGGLGFGPADYELPVAALSGGQKCRAALAKLLLQDAQFLLLDEPTNHLDIDAVRWLEKFLAGYHGGAVIVSHDRYLLDRIAERVIELAPTGTGGAVAAGGGTQIHSFPGNYSNYVATRATLRLTQERQYEKDRAFIEKEQGFIARHLAGQRSQQAKGRRTRLQRRLAAGEFTLTNPGPPQQVKIEFAGPARQAPGGKEIVRSEGLRKQYGEKVLFTDLSLIVHTGQRLGITGPNGTGKTTLLRILFGHVQPDAGTAWLSPAARVGYFAQEPAELDPARTIIEEICDIRRDFLDRDARHYAARFLFTGDDPFKRIGQLSGGEQSRVRFMKLILAAPDLLVLDEPTNHLDIPSREALEAALLDFPGTVITVSHDRYFLDRIVDRLLVMRAGDDQLYSGNYSYYIEQVEQARAAEEAAGEATRVRIGPRRSPGRRGAGRPAASGRESAGSGTQSPPARFAKLKLQELEEFIIQREQRLAQLQERFGDPQVYKDVEKITRLRAEFEALQSELAEAEQAWLHRADNS